MRFSNLRTKPKILIGVCAPLILILVLGGTAIYGINNMLSTSKWVEHTQNVLGEAGAIVSSAVDMETGMRGFLLAGKEAFLEPYNNGEQDVYSRIAALQETVDDNPGQVERLGKVEAILREWQEEVTEPAIAMRRDVGYQKTMNDIASLVGEARGKTYFDAFRQLMADFSAEEAQLMSQRKAANESAASFVYVMISVCVVLAFAMGGGIAWLLGKNIANPIVSMTQAMKNLAQGDKSVEIVGTDRLDEIGQMAAAVQVFKDNMIKNEELQAAAAREQEDRNRRAEKLDALTKRFDESSAEILQVVSAAAGQLQGTATNLSSSAEQSGSQAASVASAATQAAANVQTVASATEELTGSIDEISQQVIRSSDLANATVEEAEASRTLVQKLVDNASRIGDVVNLITDIAEQTNLLALNATIEAARAGEAGKGFAVVASEVKSLANQTGKATDEIRTQIESVQADTGTTAKAIDEIVTRIKEMSEISSTVAAAVEEQNAATQEIARNATEAASGTQEVTSHIGGVSQAAHNTNASSTDVLNAADNLKAKSEELGQMVEGFLADVRAA